MRTQTAGTLAEENAAMTLVLSCLTDDVVYQVSDRRLTTFEVPRRIMDDNSNKAVFVGGRVAFGYTGISHIENQRADTWLLGVVRTQDTNNMSATAEAIREAATRAFRRMPVASRYKRHAFQGVGWFRS